MQPKKPPAKKPPAKKGGIHTLSSTKPIASESLDNSFKQAIQQKPHAYDAKFTEQELLQARRALQQDSRALLSTIPETDADKVFKMARARELLLRGLTLEHFQNQQIARDTRTSYSLQPAPASNQPVTLEQMQQEKEKLSQTLNGKLISAAAAIIGSDKITEYRQLAVPGIVDDYNQLIALVSRLTREVTEVMGPDSSARINQAVDTNAYEEFTQALEEIQGSLEKLKPYYLNPIYGNSTSREQLQDLMSDPSALAERQYTARTPAMAAFQQPRLVVPNASSFASPSSMSSIVSPSSVGNPAPALTAEDIRQKRLKNLSSSKASSSSSPSSTSLLTVKTMPTASKTKKTTAVDRPSVSSSSSSTLNTKSSSMVSPINTSLSPVSVSATPTQEGPNKELDEAERLRLIIHTSVDQVKVAAVESKVDLRQFNIDVPSFENIDQVNNLDGELFKLSRHITAPSPLRREEKSLADLKQAITDARKSIEDFTNFYAVSSNKAVLFQITENFNLFMRFREVALQQDLKSSSSPPVEAPPQDDPIRNLAINEAQTDYATAQSLLDVGNSQAALTLLIEVQRILQTHKFSTSYSDDVDALILSLMPPDPHPLGLGDEDKGPLVLSNEDSDNTNSQNSEQLSQSSTSDASSQAPSLSSGPSAPISTASSLPSGDVSSSATEDGTTEVDADAIVAAPAAVATESLKAKALRLLNERRTKQMPTSDIHKADKGAVSIAELAKALIKVSQSARYLIAELTEVLEITVYKAIQSARYPIFQGGGDSESIKFADLAENRPTKIEEGLDEALTKKFLDPQKIHNLFYACVLSMVGCFEIESSAKSREKIDIKFHYFLLAYMMKKNAWIIARCYQ